MTEVNADKPGVIAPPPLVYLAGIALGIALDQFWPGSFWPDSFWSAGARYPVGAVLIAGGFIVVFWVFFRFRAAGTHIEPHKPTTAIVTDGLFGWSRNPVYLAMVGVSAGTGIVLDNFWVLIMLAPVLSVMQIGVIAREERYLERKFGDDYRHYKNTVRRWL